MEAQLTAGIFAPYGLLDRKRIVGSLTVILAFTIIISGEVHPARATPTGSYFDHLVVIMLEDEGMGDICGYQSTCNGPNTPYMSSLANAYGIGSQYTSLINTSEPNYYGTLDATLPAGCSQSNVPACYPPAGALTNQNLVDLLESAGLTWKGYMENQNSVSGCDTSTHSPYTHEHNGLVSFEDITSNAARCAKIALANPATNSTCTVTDCALINDLNSGSAPNFMWLTPNLCNDMHASSVCTISNGYNGCTSEYSSTCLSEGDSYMQSLVPNILNSRTFTTTRAALFITLDEGTGYCPLINSSSEDCIYAVWAGPLAKTNYRSSQFYNHYSLTKTIEVNWNLQSLTSNDANATPMTEFFQTLPADFTIGANPTSLTFTTGSSATFTVTVGARNGFSGAVNLSTSTSPSSGLAVNCAPTTISGGAGSSTCNLNGSTQANYTVTITGTSGSLSHSATVSVSVTQSSPPDFTISANPTSLVANTGVTGSSTITVSPVNGFTGTVTLAVTANSTNLSCTLSSTNVVGGSGTSTLSCTGNVAGNYLATVTGTNGPISHTASATYHVTNAPTFTVSANPSSVSVNAGATGTSTATINPQNGFTGSVALSVTTNSTSLSCSLSATTINGGSGSSTLSCTDSAPGNYLATITGTSNGTPTPPPATVTYREQDYAISANPTIVSEPVGVSGNSQIRIIPINGFTSTVTLAVSTNSTRLSCTLSPASVSGGTGSSTLSCIGSAASNDLANVTSTSGALTHYVAVTYHVTAASDFSLSASPTSLTLARGSSGQSSITVTSINSFTGTVTLTASVSSSGPIAGLNPPTITLVANGSGSSTLSISSGSAAPGTYQVNVTATSGSLSHNILVPVTVTGSASPSYALVVSYEGYVYKLYPNNTFVRIAHPVTTQLRAVAWKPDGSYALIVGDSGVLIKFDGTNFTLIPTGTTANLLSIAWKPDGSYALTGGYTGVLLRYDGTTVTQVADPYTGAYFRAMSWNPSGTQALMVSYSGGIYMYTASTGQVTQLVSPTTNDLGAVAWNPNGSYALIGGSRGVVLRYDGTGFQALNTAGVYNSSLAIRNVSFNPSGSLVLLVGDSGLMLTYNGTSLSAQPVLTSSILYSVSWNNGTADIVGGMGTTLTYSGGTESSIPSGFNSGFRGIAWKPS